jgi:hypothetical protein
MLSYEQSASFIDRKYLHNVQLSGNISIPLLTFLTHFYIQHKSSCMINCVNTAHVKTITEKITFIFTATVFMSYSYTFRFITFLYCCCCVFIRIRDLWAAQFKMNFNKKPNQQKSERRAEKIKCRCM